MRLFRVLGPPLASTEVQRQERRLARMPVVFPPAASEPEATGSRRPSWVPSGCPSGPWLYVAAEQTSAPPRNKRRYRGWTARPRWTL